MAVTQATRRRVTTIAVLVLGVAVWSGADLVPVAAGQVAPAVRPKVRVAVLPFTGPAGGLPEEFGHALGQAAHYGLEQVRDAQAIDAGPIETAALRLGLSLGGRLSDDDLLRLGKAVQARGLVVGAFALDGETLVVRTRLADLGPTPQVLAGEETRVPTADFLKPAEGAVRRVLQQLSVRTTEHDLRRLEAAFGPQTASLEAYVLYGRAVWQQGRGTKEAHERAVVLLTRAVELDQNFVLGRVALGVSLYATANRWKASGEFRKAIQLNDNFAEAHKLLGDMLVTSPRRLYDQAIASYRKALELWPDYAEARVGLGDSYQAKGQFDEAIGEYQKALALEPNNARVHLGMGKIYYNEKQLYHEAVAEYQKAMILDPTLLEVHLNLGELYEEKGLYDEAIARYRYVLSLEPKHPMATYGLAVAYEKVDVPKAIAQWESYIELAGSLPSEKEWVEIARRHLNKLQRGDKPN
jgi:tetratricopeptide (TPR) repeat protein